MTVGGGAGNVSAKGNAAKREITYSVLTNFVKPCKYKTLTNVLFYISFFHEKLLVNGVNIYMLAHFSKKINSFLTFFIYIFIFILTSEGFMSIIKA